MYNSGVIPSVKNKLEFKVIVNSFSDNINISEEILIYLKKRRVNYEKVDINQEMVLSTIEKKKFNIKESFYKEGNLAYIDSELSVPQLWINTLRLNYNQFKFLLETRLLDLILNKDACEHVRFNLNQGDSLELVHFREKNSHCLYCISERKLNPKVQIICDFRNSKDQQMNEVLCYFEKNPINIEVIDLRNKRHYSTDKQDLINMNIIPGNFSPVILYRGTVIGINTYVEYLSRNACLLCGKKKNDLYLTDECLRCTLGKKSSTLCFVQKLKLNRVNL